MTSRKKTMIKVRKALLGHDLVELPRSLKSADLVGGYVVAIGARWVVLATATSGNSDGWTVVRRKDIRDVWEVFGDRFIRRVFELEDRWPPAAPTAPLALDGTVQELVDSVAAAFPLVTIFVKDEDTISIGTPIRWTKKWVYWRYLDRNAEWIPDSDQHRRRHRHRHSEIIRVDFGGRYETSLAQVAGLIPPPTPPAH